MAMTSLLMRAGERCAVMGESERARTGRVGQERISRTLARSDGPTRNLDADIPAFARLVIASDFLEPPELWRKRLAKLSGRNRRRNTRQHPDLVAPLSYFNGRNYRHRPSPPYLATD